MKIYKVTAEYYDYDEYDSFIVWANNQEEALFLAQCEADKYFEEDAGGNFSFGAHVEEIIEPQQPCILLGSFNAG